MKKAPEHRTTAAAAAPAVTITYTRAHVQTYVTEINCMALHINIKA